MTAYETWAAAAGQTFSASGPDGRAHDLVLASAGPARRANGWLGYTLQFTAAPDSDAQQQTYRLRGAGIEEDVFLVPTGRTADALTLEAVFTVADTPEATQDSADATQDSTDQEER